MGKLTFELGVSLLLALFWVSPFTLRSSATERKELSSSWATLTSPMYMKFSTESSSLYLTPFRYRRGCW